MIFLVKLLQVRITKSQSIEFITFLIYFSIKGAYKKNKYAHLFRHSLFTLKELITERYNAFDRELLI